MKRLRHPINSIREPFGTAGLIIACVALIAALGGTALAAKGALTGKQKKEVEKIAKKYAGKPGPAGPQGNPGAPGAAGSNGAPGAAGKSVVVSTAVASECPTATTGGTGTKFEVEGSGTPSHVCNGKNGTTGFTETLPSGKTETGVWSIGQVIRQGASSGELGLSFPLGSISFSIPLAASIAEEDAHVFEGETIPTGCSGTVVEGHVTALKADPGNLCVFIAGAPSGSVQITASELFAVNPENGELGAGTPGAVLQPFPALPEKSAAYGTWAVTAE